MIDLAWPWLAAAAPVPLLVRRWLAPAAMAAQAPLRMPVLSDFDAVAPTARTARRERWRHVAAALAWLLLVGAAVRPQWLGDAIEVPVSGRDLMLAIDLSGSMEQTDFELGGTIVDRLTAAKQVADRFIERRVGDRVGLILFGRQAYLQVPLTFDRDTVRTLLDEAVIGLAGKETAIGDAIGLAVKRLSGSDASQQVLVLMTDGANTAGEIQPLTAAELAARAGLRIHTIGVGAESMTVPSLFGSRTVNPSLDLDEVTLRAIADQTGGRYFRARDTAELERIYAILDEIEPVEKDQLHYRPRHELYPWPLAGALLLAGLTLAPALLGRPE